MQNAPDGVNREQAVAYQQFVLDFQLLCLLAGKAQRRSGSPPTTSRASSRCSTTSPRSWTRAATCRCSATPTTASRCASRRGGLLPVQVAARHRRAALPARRLQAKAGTLDDKTRWLFGAQRRRRASTRSTPARRACRSAQTFPEGGYFVLGCDFDTPGEIRVVADAGPLGYRSIAAHGHADALSFSLSAGGLEFLIDPGHLRVPHAGALAELLPRHLRAQHGARRRARPVGARRQLHVALQGARRLQPVAVLAGEGQLRGLARRLHARSTTR